MNNKQIALAPVIDFASRAPESPVVNYKVMDLDDEVLIAITPQRLVAFITHLDELKGIALPPEMAREIGVALIERAALVEAGLE